LGGERREVALGALLDFVEEQEVVVVVDVLVLWLTTPEETETPNYSIRFSIFFSVSIFSSPLTLPAMNLALSNWSFRITCEGIYWQVSHLAYALSQIFVAPTYAVH